ncbi:MAG TPA: hydrolase TatD, partial [Sphingobacteriaceae bacterium]|nr:hydrolase TatD [Sphingobacteriaceae bacterium]
YYETDPALQEALMQRCFKNNVSRLFLPNVDSASVPMVLELAKKYPDNCFPMMGLHPCNVKINFHEELDFIRQAIQKNKIYAIGEIGIDLYWDKTTLEIQQEAFRLQINLAKALDLPIVIHCRDAFDEVYTILLEEKDEKLRGIFHCFTGTKEQAGRIIELGFYLGIGGVLTYKNSGLDKVVAQLDLKHLVLETDSPYLAPVPYRGKSNESSYLVHVAEKVSDLLQLPVKEIAHVTTENSRQIFGI